jgi:hypothetical protein
LAFPEVLLAVLELMLSMETVVPSLLPASLNATAQASAPTSPLPMGLTCTLARTPLVFETSVVSGTSTMARVTHRETASVLLVQADLWLLMLFSATSIVKETIK